MPLYEFRCSRCGHIFEDLVSLSKADEKKLCPRCGQDKTERLPSIFAVSGSSRAAAACPHKSQCNGGYT